MIGILVDDAPGLTKDQMLVEVDINPVGNPAVSAPKAIEAYSFCRGTRTGVSEARVSLIFGEGLICRPALQAPDLRSGCTTTTSMLIDRSSTDELWLLKPGFLGIWYAVEVIDSSVWSAFGGRSIRFIWLKDD